MSLFFLPDTAASVVTCTITAPKIGDPCQKCGENPSTMEYSSTGMLGWSHGFLQVWCDVERRFRAAKARARRRRSR